MKKFVGVVVFVMIMAVMVTAFAEPAATWSDARHILEEYARENGYDWWLDNHYDEETGTRFGLLTGSKECLMEDYGFDWDNSTIVEFERFHESVFNKEMPEAHAKIKVAPVDMYKDTMIYELLIMAECDIEPDYDGVTSSARALFVMY